MRVLLASIAAVLITGGAQAETRAKVEPIDSATARISVEAAKGLKLEKMRQIFLKTASQETLNRGCEWFQITEVIDRSQRRSVSRPGMNAAVQNSSGGYSPLRTGLMITAGPEQVVVIDRGVEAVVAFGKGPKPAGADAADAKEMLARLR